ncbi:50S ribosomal protein L24 [Rickettsiales bacterium LUAb2]
MKIKKNDEVMVIAGNYKGTIGKVIKALPKENQVIVDGVNKVKKHQKPSSSNEGGIIEKTMPIHISNVALVDAKTKKTTKIGYKLNGDKKVRFAKKTDNVIE